MHAAFRDGSEVILSWNVSSGMKLSCSIAWTLQESAESLRQQWISTAPLKR